LTSPRASIPAVFDSDSADTSIENVCCVLPVTVMQAPLIAIESPIFTSSSPSAGASISSLRPKPSCSTRTICPVAWTIPANIRP
jgi:hypothetical protein